MRLSEFITRDIQVILAAWDRFAAVQLPAAAGMEPGALRDHAEEILQAVVKDIETPQTKAEQFSKSQGRATRLITAPETAAETHAFLRAQSGFDINQMVAEYRALRASVLHLWTDACAPNATHPEDTVRFNEAIDQAVAESVAFFGAKVTQERNLFLGMMGHDMRSPLHVIQATATHLAKLGEGQPISAAATRIIKSGAQLQALLNDLIDFNRTNLGLGIGVDPVSVNLGELFADALEQLRTSHPDQQIEFGVTGDLRGIWDPHRLHQLLDNLVGNALKYGSRDAPVRVVVVGAPNEVECRVHNRGPAIDKLTLKHLFDPLVQGDEARRLSGSHGSLGLGLYIARQIALAHGGDINARSDDSETVFTVRLPRLSVKAIPSA